MRALRPVLALLAVAALACGCGEHRLKPPPPETAGAQAASTGGPAPAQSAATTPAAAMLVTRGFGGTVIVDRAVAPDQPVIAALQTVARVETRYGGGFVQAIDGVSGSLDRQEDWLYFVDGIQAEIGGAERRVRDGERIWWDYRRWGRYAEVPVVVGSWPEPFVHGDGRRRPVAADPPLADALTALGADVETGPDVRDRVLVGADAALRKRSRDWAAASRDPGAHGLTAWFGPDGVARIWDGARGRATAVPACRAVIAAVARGDDASRGIDVVVAGADDAAAAAAAAALAADPSLVARTYAACIGADGKVVAAGGRP